MELDSLILLVKYMILMSKRAFKWLKIKIKQNRIELQKFAKLDLELNKDCLEQPRSKSLSD
jgi:hypothetical protein